MNTTSFINQLNEVFLQNEIFPIENSNTNAQIISETIESKSNTISIDNIIQTYISEQLDYKFKIKLNMLIEKMVDDKINAYKPEVEIMIKNIIKNLFNKF